ncbi:NHL domain-containing protein [Quillaja saponaria]|uniref:NHL domain-containing protein n=1 Tax=Quillaja saponaria TaxID=32244 RepID=A0AAD7VGB3_QUISA|nr:NHL domain-containing protein [Quillaja saponaria]
MARSCFLLVLVFVVLFGGFSSTSATPPPAKIISGVVSNVVSALVKWLWSLKSTTKPAESSRSMMKFEGGYTVETVFDGSKLGIEPYSLDVSQGGEFLVLDSENSNIYKISSPLARYSRPKLVAGSPEGYTGHVDGWPREARLNHPKGLTVDDRGNIYIADTMNMAIRKIGDAGVTTIAGGKRSQVGGHVDGPGEDAKFSNDFDIVYIASSCSLLVIDRGNQAIREIQLHDDDCTYHYDGSFHLGIAVLVAAVFFGYMLALLQRRVKAMFSSRDDSRVPIKKGFRRKPVQYQIQQQYQQVSKHSNGWPMQESFVIPDEDEPPSLETRTPTAKRTYPFMTKDVEKPHNFKPSRPYLSGWDGDYQQQQQHHHMQQQQHHHKHYSSSPQTYYEQSCETNEIVFGAVQEQDSRRETMVIKAVDYGDPIYNHHNIRPRLNYYSHGY